MKPILVAILALLFFAPPATAQERPLEEALDAADVPSTAT